MLTSLHIQRRGRELAKTLNFWQNDVYWTFSYFHTTHTFQLTFFCFISPLACLSRMELVGQLIWNITQMMVTPTRDAGGKRRQTTWLTVVDAEMCICQVTNSALYIFMRGYWLYIGSCPSWGVTDSILGLPLMRGNFINIIIIQKSTVMMIVTWTPRLDTLSGIVWRLDDVSSHHDVIQSCTLSQWRHVSRKCHRYHRWRHRDVSTHQAFYLALTILLESMKLALLRGSCHSNMLVSMVTDTLASVSKPRLKYSWL